MTQVDVAKVLLLAGADAHARDHRSRCPLHMAALAGSEELARALLTCGADPNKASDLGTTALHNAVREKEVVRRPIRRASVTIEECERGAPRFSGLCIGNSSAHTFLPSWCLRLPPGASRAGGCESGSADGKS